MKKYILLLVVLISTASMGAGFLDSHFNQGKAAVISLNGQIMPTSQPGAFSSGGSITPENLRNLNSKAESKDANAIIYEINSGGGSVVASKELMREIDSVDTPTICRFRDVSASGAYLAALGCDKIIADSATITGSIGVKSSYLEYSELIQNYGVEYINISSGKYKEVGSPFKNTTKEDRKILKNKTDRIHQQFVSKVVEERNLTKNEEETIRTGNVFLGERAEKIGLVDTLGGRRKALKAAENITGKNLDVEKIQTTPEFSILSMLASTPFSNFVSQQPLLKARWR